MAKFLDYTGLSYLWGKITTALSNKMDKTNPSGTGIFDMENDIEVITQYHDLHDSTAKISSNITYDTEDTAVFNTKTLTISDGSYSINEDMYKNYVEVLYDTNINQYFISAIYHEFSGNVYANDFYYGGSNSVSTSLSNKMDNVAGAGQGRFIISGGTTQNTIYCDHNSSSNAYIGVRSGQTSGGTNTSSIYLRSATDGTRNLATSNSNGTTINLVTVDDNNSVSGAIVSTRKNGTADSTSAANKTWVNKAHVQLSEGLWIIIANCYWDTNSSGARFSCISPNSASATGNVAYMRTMAVNTTPASTTNHSLTAVVNIDTGTPTYYLCMYQNSGASSALGIGGGMTAIRLGIHT